MIIKNIKGRTYRLPNKLSPFQEDMYAHLIEWKWSHITKNPGYFKYKGQLIPYDAIIPEEEKPKFPIIYPPVVDELKEHLKQLPFKLHEHFNHMASSQAANVNLFLPILLNPDCNKILRSLRNDFNYLAKNELFKGYRIEYWADNKINKKGILGDHSPVAGTDTDIAIAYYNHKEELCLWLIEHKLTENEFTTCGGTISEGRKPDHNCSASFSDILANKDICYYHSGSKFNYWNITEENKSFFLNTHHQGCPFKGGLNQLWRNQLMGLALESRGDYKHVYFSVVHHPDNHSLDNSINQYKKLINDNPKFSCFASKDVLEAALLVNDLHLSKWVSWYKEIYMIK